MAEIKEGNWSHQQPPLSDGDMILGGNFAQLLPATKLAPTVREVRVIGGNFVNCDKADCLSRGWIIEGGNWAQVDWCTHHHPHLVERGLPACKADCKHRKSGTLVWVDINETELRAAKDAARKLDPTAPVVRIVESAADIDGLKTVLYQKQTYEYIDAMAPTAAKEVTK